MRDFVITTDSNSDIPIDFVKQHQMVIIPQYYGFDDEVYGDEKNMTPSEFYQRMRDGQMPTSMANNPAVIASRFESLLKSGCDILHIAFSSQLSGSYNNVVVTANELMSQYPGSTIEVVDSCSASLGETLLIMRAFEQKADGRSLAEVKADLEDAKKRLRVDFTVDDLHHLQKGGRISKTTAVFGSVVQIKPILTIEGEGKLIPAGKARGRKKSFSTLIDRVIETCGGSYGSTPIGIIHGDCLDDARHVEQMLVERVGCTNIIISDISPSIGTHAGPGVLGICYWDQKA